jgi:signal transduction histidine kinase
MPSIAIRPTPGWSVRSGYSPVYPIVVAAAAALWVLAVWSVAAAAPSEARLDRALLEALIVGVPIGAGVYALRTPQTVRFGALLTGAGALWSLTALGESSESVPYSIGRVSAWLIFPVLIYLILAFPSGRPAPGVDRMLFGAITLLIAMLFVGSAFFVDAYPAQTPWATCKADCPANAMLVLDAEPALMDHVVAPLRELLAVLLLGAVTQSVIRRGRAASALQWRMIAPLLVTSVVFTVSLSAYLVTRRAVPDAPAVEALGRLWSLSIPAVAAGFLVGLVRRRMLVGEVLTKLSVALSQRLDRGHVRAALAAALDDAEVELLVPDEVPGRWRDSEGRVTSRSAAAADGRSVTSIEDDGRTVAALVHDPALRDDDELFDALRALVLTTVWHERLTTRLATSLNELDVSRKRIARAADIERSRIERDLHDGAQQRLIGLRIKLSLAEELARSDPEAGADAMHELGGDVELALDELRSLAHGVYPSLLSDRGLRDALRSVFSESPLPVRLSIRGAQRHTPEVETAIYFTCLEAAQNAIKHAKGATGLWVTIRENSGVRFEVRDDGQGFEPPSGDFNGGLRNMRDRLEAMGGRLTIDSAPGHGTRIRGIIPLR